MGAISILPRPVTPEAGQPRGRGPRTLAGCCQTPGLLPHVSGTRGRRIRRLPPPGTRRKSQGNRVSDGEEAGERREVRVGWKGENASKVIRSTQSLKGAGRRLGRGGVGWGVERRVRGGGVRGLRGGGVLLAVVVTMGGRAVG